jgi:hypothetical protein
MAVLKAALVRFSPEIQAWTPALPSPVDKLDLVPESYQKVATKLPKTLQIPLTAGIERLCRILEGCGPPLSFEGFGWTALRAHEIGNGLLLFVVHNDVVHFTPLPSLPLKVDVLVFPSAETAVITVIINWRRLSFLESWRHRVSVDALHRYGISVCADNRVIFAVEFCAVFNVDAVPSALVPSASILTPFSSESTSTVTSFGVGPGLYFDFAGFIFQVPECWSAVATTLSTRAAIRRVGAKMANLFIRNIHLRVLSECGDRPTGW